MLVCFVLFLFRVVDVMHSFQVYIYSLIRYGTFYFLGGKYSNSLQVALSTGSVFAGW
jgi:hypothetical protein